MSHPYPLQPADRAPDYSGRDSSTAGDRRPSTEEPNAVRPEMGVNAAPQIGSPVDLAWRPGQLPPSSFLMAPFDPVHVQGDNSGQADEVHEIDIRSYGDCYDPTSPMRVIQTDWAFDPDSDGHV